MISCFYALFTMFSCLDLGFAMLCALCGLVLFSLWGHFLVWLHPSLLWLIWEWPLVKYNIVVLDCLMQTLSPLCAMLCLPCLLCATCLSFFASLHFCMLAYMFMHESLLACDIKPNSYYLVQVHTNLWYMRPRVPYRNFFWWHVCRPYSNPMELQTPDLNLHLSS